MLKEGMQSRKLNGRSNKRRIKIKRRRREEEFKMRVTAKREMKCMSQERHYNAIYVRNNFQGRNFLIGSTLLMYI